MAHTDAFNAVAPQMYSVGCDSAPGAKAAAKSKCSPVLISDTSDPGITPDPALAKRFLALGPHVEYWPTLSSPDWLNADACKPPDCYNGTGSPVARCPCGQAPNETATMEALLASPESLIASAIAEAKKVSSPKSDDFLKQC